MLMNLWKAKFRWEFRSSQGMGAYVKQHESSGYLITKLQSLEDVKAVIQGCMDSQSHLIELLEATYLGECLIKL